MQSIGDGVRLHVRMFVRRCLSHLFSIRRYGGDMKSFNRFYILPNPWDMDSPGEQHRYTETNRLIVEKIGKVGSLLEVGCGEGHQSLFLQQICDYLTGLDVSRRAVKRARKRCPGSRFLAGDICSKSLAREIPFDLVVACEVIYYMRDITTAVEQMRALGRMVVVTYFDGEVKKLDPEILSVPGCESATIQYGPSLWRVAWFAGMNR